MVTSKGWRHGRVAPPREHPQRRHQTAALAHRGGRRQRGLLLVELAVAVAVLGILAISALLVMIPVGQQARLNRELSTAASAVRNVLEQVQATPFNDIVTTYPDGTVIEVGKLPDGQIEVRYEDVAADPLELELTIRWESSEAGPMSRSYVTVKTE